MAGGAAFKLLPMNSPVGSGCLTEPPYGAKWPLNVEIPSTHAPKPNDKNEFTVSHSDTATLAESLGNMELCKVWTLFKAAAPKLGASPMVF